ncbi:MAG TPA: hypothetical protein VKO87_09865, partial [Gemmatimonadaceae bacterium]|nr:hypothetical protein [Gemmatimonadaceae bacterium]
MSKGRGGTTPPSFSAAPGWRRSVWTWGAVGLAVAAIVACSEDQAVKNKSMTGPAGPNYVTALPGEVNLVDSFTAIVNGATWVQAQNFKVGT